MQQAQTRCQAIYLLVDCSSSMAGEPLESVKQAIKALCLELGQNPQMQALAWLALLVYDSNAGERLPLTPLAKFRLPTLQAGGTSSLSKGLTLLSEVLEEEGTFNLPPWVFLFTDGEATDDWGKALATLNAKQQISLIVFGAGAKANLKQFVGVAQGCLMLNTLAVGDFSNYFV